ncbi:hypothetical protein, conserved [Leishmania tarentolae]|uniref:Uncharacterized protein n=1 Tax=Leishmania tarentolae TaxID=5689 RepID=A0A640KZZ3_LEITA|nr:hypothetical protein, conserved [Leishmania tarentolae]
MHAVHIFPLFFFCLYQRLVYINWTVRAYALTSLVPRDTLLSHPADSSHAPLSKLWFLSGQKVRLIIDALLGHPYDILTSRSDSIASAFCRIKVVASSDLSAGTFLILLLLPKFCFIESMEDCDGDLSNVNPGLLKLCANPEEWREQRRRAMKAKIFGTDTQAGASLTAEAYLPTDTTFSPSPSSAQKTSTASYSGQQGPLSQQATESYILQQILSHKRRREEANGEKASVLANPPQVHSQQPMTQQQQNPTASQGEGLSLKEKLMRKYRKD